MTTKRAIGSETEFGIATRDPESVDPVSNSLFLINHYPNFPSPKILWDYENENPLLDIRGFEVEGERERPGPDYNRLLNKVLANGGRLYVDGAHPEYSTPECTTARDVVLYEKAGERILAAALRAVEQVRGAGSLLVYKNNTDGKGNSYGYHENYLVARDVPFERVARALVPFLVTRQIFAGAGKVGAENQSAPAVYQLSQRADFFETLMDLNTMVKRPIINTRDEPHADPARYRRLHVIAGDVNMAECATFLKVGTMAIVLDLIEENWALPAVDLDDPVQAIKAVSRDLEVKAELRLAGGKTTTAIAVQRVYLKAAQDFYASHELTLPVKEVLIRWEETLDKLERDPRELVRELDWVAKRALIESYLDRKGCGWEDPRVAMMDLQYHDVRPEKGLYFTLERANQVERIVMDEEVQKAETVAPLDTRAYFRAACVKKWPQEVYAASWTSVLFDIGNATIKKVPLMEPLRGTEALTKSLLDESETVDALLDKLKA
ncbi:MAG TPA: depupylase/deamidase Dop [Nitrospirales bacterium]|jgi:proteasome accessory factor A|nr:depupylase/deamidase Dop [Nitrospirales bacterium]